MPHGPRQGRKKCVTFLRGEGLRRYDVSREQNLICDASLTTIELLKHLNTKAYIRYSLFNYYGKLSLKS